MLLTEFIYFNGQQADQVDDLRYNSDNDTSVLKSKDLRKTRLTLRMLNDLRKAGDAREQEKKEDLGLVRKMYAAPPPEAAPVA
jgi:nucleosome binding factor SPN SPT16 subunit